MSRVGCKPYVPGHLILEAGKRRLFTASATESALNFCEVLALQTRCRPPRICDLRGAHLCLLDNSLNLYDIDSGAIALPCAHISWESTVTTAAATFVAESTVTDRY